MDCLYSPATRDFIIGCVVGAVLVGSSTQRTIAVHEGRLWSTFMNANLNSVSYYFSIYFIAKDNLVAYLGTVLGSMVIVMYMATKYRIKNENKNR